MQGRASGGLLQDCRPGGAQGCAGSLRARSWLRAPALPTADLWPRGGCPKELPAMTSPLLSVHNRKCSPPTPLPARRKWGSLLTAPGRDLVSGPTLSTLVAQGLLVQGLSGAAWAESQQGEHWPRTAQPGDPEHPEGSRKGGPSAE